MAAYLWLENEGPGKVLLLITNGESQVEHVMEPDSTASFDVKGGVKIALVEILPEAN